MGLKKFLFLIILHVAFGDDQYTFDTRYINVPLDHYSFTTNYTFPLRYLVNNTYHDGKGPIFFYTGNELSVELFAQNTGFIFDIAPQFNALIVFAEHRYYGESLPFGEQSFSSPENLGYLSSTQALGDFVYLINALQKNYTVTDDVDKIPAVAFGGSYGGMLAAWLKMKFPHSVVGAIASSAPIWAFGDLNPCNTFYSIISDDYSSLGGEDCANNIRNSWQMIRTLTESNEGKSEISQLLNLCTELKSSTDVEELIGWLGGLIVNFAELNYPYATDFGFPLPEYPLQQFCSKFNFKYENYTDFFKGLGDALTIYTNLTGTATCNNFTPEESKIGDSAWGFQSCTELTIPMCIKDEDIFENYDYKYQDTIDYCVNGFGVTPLGEDTPILQYGGKDLSAANNIVFSNGLWDPWSGYGVLTNVTSKIVAVIIPDGAHHVDLRASNEKDTETIKNARQVHVSEISRWLNEYYNEER